MGVKLMLEAGYDPNARNQRMETPLMACLKYCHDSTCRAGIIKLLIENGADVNLQNSQGQTVLIYATILNQLDTVNLLLLEGLLDINKTDDDGNTALMYASNLGFEHIVAAFLESHRRSQHYIDFIKRNYEGFTAMDHAIDCGNFDIVRLLSPFIKIPGLDYLKMDEPGERSSGSLEPRASPISLKEFIPECNKDEEKKQELKAARNSSLFRNVNCKTVTKNKAENSENQAEHFKPHIINQALTKSPVYNQTMSILRNIGSTKIKQNDTKRDLAMEANGTSMRTDDHEKKPRQGRLSKLIDSAGINLKAGSSNLNLENEDNYSLQTTAKNSTNEDMDLTLNDLLSCPDTIDK